MARYHKQQRVEWLRARLGALRSQIGLLPQQAQTEFRPLVDDLAAQLEESARKRGGVRRLLDEIRAIDKCLHFERTMSLQDLPVPRGDADAEGKPHWRLDLRTITEPHLHLRRSQVQSSMLDI